MAVRAFDAAINGVNNARELVLWETGDDITVVHSASDGAFIEMSGTEDWEGYYSAYGAVSANGYPNDALSLAFNINQAVDVGGSGTAIIEAVRIDWDFVKNWPLMHTVKFAGNGAFTWGAQTTSDTSTVALLPSRDGDIKVATPAGSPSFASVDRVVRAQLTVFSDTTRYADSSTSTGYKRAAGVLGWNVLLDVHADDPSAQETLNGDKHVRMYADATNYWDIQWVRWKKIGEFKVPIDGREHVVSRYHGSGTGFTDIGGTWTQGQLVDCDTVPTTIWS